MVEMEDDTFDCKICLEPATDPLTCRECSTLCCSDCNKKLKNQKECPMCRHESALIPVKDIM